MSRTLPILQPESVPPNAWRSLAIPLSPVAAETGHLFCLTMPLPAMACHLPLLCQVPQPHPSWRPSLGLYVPNPSECCLSEPILLATKPGVFCAWLWVQTMVIEKGAGLAAASLNFDLPYAIIPQQTPLDLSRTVEKFKNNPSQILLAGVQGRCYVLSGESAFCHVNGSPLVKTGALSKVEAVTFPETVGGRFFPSRVTWETPVHSRAQETTERAICMLLTYGRGHCSQFYLHIHSFSVYICEFTCLCMQLCVHMYARLWKPEINIWCLFWSLSILPWDRVSHWI